MLKQTKEILHKFPKDFCLYDCMIFTSRGKKHNQDVFLALNALEHEHVNNWG